MRKFNKSIFALAFALILFGCEDSDNVIDQVLNDVDTTTPFLRILNEAGSSLDIFNTASEHTWQLEYQLVANDPSLDGLAGVDFFVSFTDNNMEDGVDYSTGPAAFGSLSPGDFNIAGDFGGSVAEFGYSLQSAMDALGLDASQLSGGDTFLVTWEMTLDDGRVFGPNDVSGDVAAVGGYYSSQYALQASLVCEFDQPDFFTGTYQIDQETGSDPFFASETFGTQTVELTAPAGTTREFIFLYFPGIFDFEQRFSMSFVCDRIEVTGGAVSGALGCGGGSLGQANQPDVPIFFDTTFAEDTDLLLQILDFEPDAGCDTGSYPINVRLTKL